MPVVAVGRPLREKLGDDGVDSLLELLNESQTEQKNGILEFVEEKFERRLTAEIGRLRDELVAKVSEGDAKLAAKISEGDAKLAEKISERDAKLAAKISEGDAKLAERISEGDAKLAERISEGDNRLFELIQSTKSEIIRWMFIFWAGQIIVLVGILSLFLRR